MNRYGLNFPCELCSRKFKTEKNLNTHVANIHSTVKKDTKGISANMIMQKPFADLDKLSSKKKDKKTVSKK